MSKNLALLRGINVGGQQAIRMEALKLLFEALGYKRVRTYIQSGNVVFEDDSMDGVSLGFRIEEKIMQDLCMEVSVMIRSHDQLKNVLLNNPFSGKVTEKTSLYVTFLSGVPSEIDLEKVSSVIYPPDEFIISGSEIYVHCPLGYGKTKLNNTFFERKLKLKATTRNWRTINELNAMMGA